jgi:hypothetical protein
VTIVIISALVILLFRFDADSRRESTRFHCSRERPVSP